MVLKFERLPSVVEAVGVGETDVVECCTVLGVPVLHPEHAFGDAGFGGDSETTHAAADAGERLGVPMIEHRAVTAMGRDEGPGIIRAKGSSC
jgi:hypothetical protein